MTKLSHQHQAISTAVKSALHKIGLEALKSEEFFGTNQRLKVAEEIKQAA